MFLREVFKRNRCYASRRLSKIRIGSRINLKFNRKIKHQLLRAKVYFCLISYDLIVEADCIFIQKQLIILLNSGIGNIGSMG